MRKILLISFLLGFLNFKAQENKITAFDAQYINWYNKNIKDDKVNGTNVYKAYKELLNGKQPKQKIIVAVIDGGVDPQHEDLKANMWVNKDEIAGNGKDDDNNGYIDDIYGWNFLGNAEGENVNEENLESTRIFRALHEKYKDVEKSEAEDKKEYELYEELGDEYWKNREKYGKEFKELGQAKMAIDFVYTYLEGKAGKPINSINDIKAIKDDSEQTTELKNAAIQMYEQGLDKKEFGKYYDQTKKFYECYYNINFSSRDKVIGDNVTDITDINYGNPDVKGPDAFHGTFCAGIISAVRNNNMGVDGIADNVEIMAIRAVPNGDEYDKDIALAIRYAVDNGAKVVNMSFGKAYSPQKQMVDEAIEYANSKGVLLIHAAGNDSENVDEKEFFPNDKLNSGKEASNVLTVGASSIFKNKKMPAPFSNYGKTQVDLFAPGVDIVSLAPDNTYDQADGTSFAAPVVTGIAALVWSYYPNLTHTQLKEVLMKSVTDLGKKKVYVPSPLWSSKKKFSELSVTGGIVNAYEALKLAEQY